MSSPASFIARIANGFTRGEGLVPAEYTSNLASNDFKNPSDIWLRAEFPVHKTNTRFFPPSAATDTMDADSNSIATAKIFMKRAFP